MTSDAREQPRLTPKGERTRARIIEVAARLMHERSVAGATLEDVKAAAHVSGSQLYHYFPDKDDLVQAVIDRQADTITGIQRQADLGSPDGLRAWRDTVIAQAASSNGKGGCPLGSLAGQLAETDPRARALIAAGFEHWSAAISDGLRRLQAAGRLPASIDADDYATTPARNAAGRPPARPGPAGHPSSPDCGRHPPRPHHRQPSLSRIPPPRQAAATSARQHLGS